MDYQLDAKKNILTALAGLSLWVCRSDAQRCWFCPPGSASSPPHRARFGETPVRNRNVGATCRVITGPGTSTYVLGGRTNEPFEGVVIRSVSGWLSLWKHLRLVRSFWAPFSLIWVILFYAVRRWRRSVGVCGAGFGFF